MLVKVLILNILLLYIASTVTTTKLEPFQLDEYLKGTFVSKGFNGTWISDTHLLYSDPQLNIYKFDATRNSSTLFLNSSVFAGYPGSSVTYCDNLTYALIRYNTKTVYRHSVTAQYVVYDVQERTYHDVHNKSRLQLVQWGPKCSLAYVFENNIYYSRNISILTNARQIAFDGVPGIVYNGVPDWVFEEEVLGSGSALWFSPDGENLEFGYFSDLLVKDFHYFKYGESSDQYPTLVTLKYPKVNTTNPTVTIRSVTLKSLPRNSFIVKDVTPSYKEPTWSIIQDVAWVNDTDYVLIALNRVQNNVLVQRCTVRNVSCENIYTRNETKGWIELTMPTFNGNGSKFIMLTSEPEGNDSYKHLSLVENDNFDQRTRLTFGKREVLKVYGWDETRDLVYYSGTVAGEHGKQHVYVVDLKTKVDRCFTCNFITPEGPCTVADASFSKGFSFCMLTCSGPGPATVQIQNLQSSNNYNWETNAKLRDSLSIKLQPVVKSLSVVLPSGFKAHVRMLLPPELNETSLVTYPMIVNVYGGPKSNQISDAYSADVQNYFVTNRKYIYTYIDGRGSGKNGDNNMFQIYRRLGTVEIADQIEVTKYLQDRYSFIDRHATGIWGWSYGGFATLHALVQDTTNVFKFGQRNLFRQCTCKCICDLSQNNFGRRPNTRPKFDTLWFGLAVAPVTNFILFNLYTERYMGLNTMSDNMAGYNHTDVSRVVEAFRNKTLYLIHGNADDNVHYQQSMLLAKALEKADIMFFQQSYPDEDHNIGSVRPHLYHTIDTFFDHAIRHERNGKIWKLNKNIANE